MTDKIFISVIIPVYNAEKYIGKCLNSVLSQDFKKRIEIIMIDDASTDCSIKEIKKHNISFLKLYSESVNKGPSATRNIGIKNASGKYIFMMDVDDDIATNTLSTLYNVAEKDDCDLVFSDFKRIENSKNQRENTFNYPHDKFFHDEKILETMKEEIFDHNPLFAQFGLIGCNSRLIKRSILQNNNVLFIEQLRYLDDKIFGWSILAFVQKAKYVRKQLYSYYVNPNQDSGNTASINYGFPIENFKIAKSHIEKSLKQRGLDKNELMKCGDQALIFYIITLLISYSRSIILGKVDAVRGKNNRRKIIKEIINDKEIIKAVKNYIPSKQESMWIPRAISLGSQFLTELACNIRAKNTIKKRRKGE